MSRSSHTNINDQSAYSVADSENIYIKIPGPQIIGWFMQATPEDKSSTTYTRIDASQFQDNANINKAVGKSNDVVNERFATARPELVTSDSTTAGHGTTTTTTSGTTGTTTTTTPKAPNGHTNFLSFQPVTPAH